MSHTRKHEIWPSATGITDLEEGLARRDPWRIAAVGQRWDRLRQGASPEQLISFSGELSRDWAIHANTDDELYKIDRGVTETLIVQGLKMDVLERSGAIRSNPDLHQILLDQEAALDGIFDFVKGDRSLSPSYVKELHAQLLRSQSTSRAVDPQGGETHIELVKGDWKKFPNFPMRGDVLYTYCPPEQVASEMERLLQLHDQHLQDGVPVHVQAAWLHHRFTQIHPFQDGNGRLARALATLVFVKARVFPLIVKGDDRQEYLTASEAADAGKLLPLADFFLRMQQTQLNRAIEALGIGADDQDQVGEASPDLAWGERAVQPRTLDAARAITDQIAGRLREIERDMDEVLGYLSGSATTGLVVEPDGGDFLRDLVLQEAGRLGYAANFSDIRSSVRLELGWGGLRAHLLFSVHGYGRNFDGRLICTAVCTVQGRDEEGRQVLARIPVAERGFVFQHDRNPALVGSLARPWCEEVLAAFVQALRSYL